MARKKKEEQTTDSTSVEESTPQASREAITALAEDPAADLLDQLSIEAPPRASLFGESSVMNLSEETQSDGGTEEKVRPPMSSPEWTEYVMSHFREDELANGHPKVDGLRRVIEELLGPVVQDEAEIKCSPTPENGHTAAVQCRVCIECVYLENPSGSIIRVFTGAADVSCQNAEPEFARFPTALAETRARGRAYRNALRLKTCAAEEMTAVPVDPQEQRGFIGRGQVSFIDMMCQRLNINATAFISNWLAENGKRGAYKAVREISGDDAREMTKLLNHYQRHVPEIPSKIVGYKSDWNSKN